MRLSPNQVQVIRSCVRRFDPEAKIALFGSRANDQARGGDIDLLCLSKAIDRASRRRLRVELLKALGDQKIDLIIAPNSQSPFVQLILPESVEL
jgi:predicted nucleotidyltransferase